MANLRRELHHLREGCPKLDALIDADRGLPAALFEFVRGGLPLLGRFRLARIVEGDRLANERRERGLVNLFTFVDVDRSA